MCVCLNAGKLRLPPVTYQEYAASWPEVWGNNLPPLALYLVLHPDDVDTARFLVRYMDRLASYESWRTTAAPEDDVAVSHSLVGFATALDMAYGRLDRDRRRRYVAKVAAMTEQLYTMSYSKWWGKSLLQVCQVQLIVSQNDVELTSRKLLYSHDMLGPNHMSGCCIHTTC